MPSQSLLLPAESNPAINPNHPLIRCVDGTGPYGEWTSADDTARKVTGPYRVFDVLNQRHIGPVFRYRFLANLYLRFVGGNLVKT